MNTTAVVLEAPQRLDLATLDLAAPGEKDVVVDIEWSGISTGTERLLWSGRMPSFPGMGYPLVPGYESVGRVEQAGAKSGRREGDFVFVPGANCYGKVRGLFGGAASRIVVSGARITLLDERLGQRGVLLALAATAHHAISAPGSGLPDLIVGHGILGRLLARLALAKGGRPPTVWERNPERRTGSLGYPVMAPDEDERRDYHHIYDASGDAAILDTLISRITRGGEVVLAGFYQDRPNFAFPPAFMREARLRIAAEWTEADLRSAKTMIEGGELSLDGLITHTRPADTAAQSYETAFTDPSCLKMVLDWRTSV